MSKIIKSYRGIEEDLIKDVQHLAIDTNRSEGDLVNEALMLLLKDHEKKKKKQSKSDVETKKDENIMGNDMEMISNEIKDFSNLSN